MVPQAPQRCPQAIALFVMLCLGLHAGASEPARAATEEGVAAPAVVELFTSQGCNSCPPADRMVGELAQRADVIALSLHVNYWDYIGWPDPYASAKHTERQQAYVRRLEGRYVYTPQIVVDGREQVSGTRAEEVADAIVRARRRGKPIVPRFESGAQAGSVDIVIPAARIDEPATVWLAFYDRKQVTRVPRGENAGKVLENYNVVREFRQLATYTGERLRISLDMDDERAEGRSGCAILVQRDVNGPILGAADMELAEDAM